MFYTVHLKEQYCRFRIYCGSRILRIREPLGTQSPKPFPGTFLPENLENFSQFFFFFFSF